MGEGGGRVLFASALAVLCGSPGWFDTLMQKVQAIAAAILAGVLLRFGLGAFTAFAGPAGGRHVAGRFLLCAAPPGFAVPLTWLIGLALAAQV